MNMEMLLQAKKNNKASRLGHMFYTSSTSYFYDSGTGKVVALEKDIASVLDSFFDEQQDYATFLDKVEQLPSERRTEFIKFIQDENLLQCPEIVSFSGSEKKENNEVRFKQIIIELTGRCNLRCKYCIYNDYNEMDRPFNTNNISFETAKKAIDYTAQYRDKDYAVTFYGGEPLLNFETMRKCIEYARQKTNGDVSFSFTSNMTLMTKDIADYLVQVPNLSIVISLDGPRDIHNTARVYANNRSTFEDVMRGIELLTLAMKEHNSKIGLTVNCVFMPPYTQKRLDEINGFFESLKILPDTCSVQITYPTPGSIPETYLQSLKNEGIEIMSSENPLDEWLNAKMIYNAFEDPAARRNIYTYELERILTKVHNRQLTEEPFPAFSRNACCTPGQRRLYVTTEGEYKVCERIGNSPTIGNVDIGLDFEAIKKYYIQEYDEKSKSACSNCWAVHMCNVCYANCFSAEGVDMKKKNEWCRSTRKMVENILTMYHEFMEKCPEKMDFIKDIVIY